MRYEAAPDCDTPNVPGVRPAAAASPAPLVALYAEPPMALVPEIEPGAPAAPAPDSAVNVAARTAVQIERLRRASLCIHAVFHIAVSLIGGCPDNGDKLSDVVAAGNAHLERRRADSWPVHWAHEKREKIDHCPGRAGLHRIGVVDRRLPSRSRIAGRRPRLDFGAGSHHDVGLPAARGAAGQRVADPAAARAGFCRIRP